MSDQMDTRHTGCWPVLLTNQWALIYLLLAFLTHNDMVRVHNISQANWEKNIKFGNIFVQFLQFIIWKSGRQLWLNFFLIMCFTCLCTSLCMCACMCVCMCMCNCVWLCDYACVSMHTCAAHQEARGLLQFVSSHLSSECWQCMGHAVLIRHLIGTLPLPLPSLTAPLSLPTLHIWCLPQLLT